jgi:hypothetical protein
LFIALAGVGDPETAIPVNISNILMSTRASGVHCEVMKPMLNLFRRK